MLFCPNCGKSVSKDDNYCPLCGKQLKDVKIRVERAQQDTLDLSESMEKTRVFNIKSLDGIDTTDDIKDIIHAVDEKISKNIKKYETQGTSKITDEMIAQSEQLKGDKHTSSPKDETGEAGMISSSTKEKNSTSDSKVQQDSVKKPVDPYRMTQSELVRRVQEELKKEGYKDIVDEVEDIDQPKAETKPKRKSFKTLWKNFINEDDDEYSIFSSLSDQAKNKKIAKERNLEVSSTTPDRSIEDTMSVPKIVIPPDEKKAEEMVEKYREEKRAKETSDEKTLNPKDESSKKIMKKEEIKESPAAPIPDSSSKDHLKDKFLKWKSRKRDEKAAGISQKPENIEKKTKVERDNREALLWEKKKDSDETKAEGNKKPAGALNAFLFSLNQLLQKLVDKTQNIHGKGFKIMILIGIIMTALPILLAQEKLGISFLFFLAIKLIFDFIQFFTALNVTTDRAWVDTSMEEVKLFSVINWFICKFFLLIAFIFSPWGGVFNFQLLGALTAMPVSTILLFFLTLYIGMALYWPQLKNQSKIDFTGWYLLVFILFELLFKLFWFFINFIFNTLF